MVIDLDTAIDAGCVFFQTPNNAVVCAQTVPPVAIVNIVDPKTGLMLSGTANDKRRFKYKYMLQAKPGAGIYEPLLRYTGITPVTQSQSAKQEIQNEEAATPDGQTAT